MSRKKQILLTTAETIFSKEGFQAVSLRHIVKEANIAMMTVYNNFESKEDLIVEVLEKQVSIYFDYLDFSNEISKTRIELQLAELHLCWMREQTLGVNLLYKAKKEFSSPSHHYSTKLVNVMNSITTKLIEYFQTRGIYSSAAFQLCLLFEGVIALSQSYSVNYIAEPFIKSVKSIFPESEYSSSSKTCFYM